MRRRAGVVAVLGMAIGGVVAAEAASPAQGHGTGIQGVVTTSVRPPRPLRVTFDQKVCGAELPDRSIVVDSAGNLANAVVTLLNVKARRPAREVTVVNEKCTFVPRVQVVGTKATMKTSSRDSVLHTTTVQLGDGRQLFNLALPVPNLELAKPLEGSGPLRVGCSTHQWMRGWIFVTDDVAIVTGPDGRFTLPDVPPGTYQVRVWHEALKASDRTVTVAAGQITTLNVAMQ